MKPVNLGDVKVQRVIGDFMNCGNFSENDIEQFNFGDFPDIVTAKEFMKGMVNLINNM